MNHDLHPETARLAETMANIPEHMRDGLILYLDQGVRPGSFLRAVLENKFTHSFACADHINTAAIANWAAWMHNRCPIIARGSVEKVEAWIKLGGFHGMEARARERDGSEAQQ